MDVAHSAPPADHREELKKTEDEEPSQNQVGIVERPRRKNGMGRVTKLLYSSLGSSLLGKYVI